MLNKELFLSPSNWRFFLSAVSAVAVATATVFAGNFSLVQAAPLTLERITEMVEVIGAPNDTAVESIEMTPDGRYVAFASNASNLVADDVNGMTDVFVYDNVTEIVELISVSSDGEQGDGTSGGFSKGFVDISDDGRYVAFGSTASNLVPGDVGGNHDIFVRDRLEETTERVSVNDLGIEADAHSYRLSISGNGRFVTFETWASNLDVTDLNGVTDIYVHDRDLNTTVRASVDSNGNETASVGSSADISFDGRYICFDSGGVFVPGDNNGLADVFLRDLVGGTTERVSLNSAGGQINASDSNGCNISGDGNRISFSSQASDIVPGDTNNRHDIFVRDRLAGTTVRASVSSLGGQHTDVTVLDSKISSNGRYVNFATRADNLVPDDTDDCCYDLFMHDLNDSTTIRMNLGIENPDRNSESDEYAYSYSKTSDDGTTVAFISNATNLVGDDHYVGNAPYIRINSDIVEERDTFRIHASSDYTPIFGGNGSSQFSAISENGRYIVFTSQASNLGVEDLNGVWDIYLYDSQTESLEIVSVDSNELPSNGNSWYPSVSSDGRYIVFESEASNLVAGDTNDSPDVFLRDRTAGTTIKISNSTEGGDVLYAGFATYSGRPVITPNGNFIAYISGGDNIVVGDTEEVYDAFVYDRLADTTERVSVNSAGDGGDDFTESVSISNDGNLVLFTSFANNIHTEDDPDFALDAFLHNRTTGNTQQVSFDYNGNMMPEGVQANAVISGNGRYVVMDTSAPLMEIDAIDGGGARDIYRLDLQTDELYLVSQTSLGGMGNGDSVNPQVSYDGDVVVYQSYANNIIVDDDNFTSDIFIRFITEDETEVVSATLGGEIGNWNSMQPFISQNKGSVTFSSEASNLVEGFTQATDVYFLTYEADEPPAPEPEAPTVTTLAATGIAQTSATINANITSIGSQSVTTRGFEYGLTDDYEFTTISNGVFGTGAYNTILAGLECGTTYFFQAYATNVVGTGNGAGLSFETLACDEEENGGGGSGSSSGSVTGISSTNAPHPNGTLVIDGNTIYLIKDRMLYGFRDAEEYRSYGYNFNQTVVISSQDRTLPASAEALKAMTGSLVLDTSDNRTVYMIGVNNTKRGFVSEQVYFQLGYNYNNLFRANLSDYNTGPIINNPQAAHPEGTLARENDATGTVWWILNGTRHGFESEQVFDTYGFNFQRLVEASSADLSLPIGSLVKLRDGTLVTDNEIYYIISDGKKLQFNSAQALQNWGYKLSNVIAASINQYETGTRLR